LEGRLAAETAARIRAEEALQKMQKNGFSLNPPHQNGIVRQKDDECARGVVVEAKELSSKAPKPPPARVWYEPSRSQFMEEIGLLVPSLFWLNFLTAE
jgi:hypothetical protein